LSIEKCIFCQTFIKNKSYLRELRQSVFKKQKAQKNNPAKNERLTDDHFFYRSVYFRNSEYVYNFDKNTHYENFRFFEVRCIKNEKYNGEQVLRRVIHRPFCGYCG